MNKAERHRLKMKYYRRRLKKYGLTEKDNQHVFRTTGKPCSCNLCKIEKYSRKEKHKYSV